MLHKLCLALSTLALTFVCTAGVMAQEATPKGTQEEAPASQAPMGSVGIQAPVGTAFTYQGQLKQNGSPVSGVSDFRFILYNADIGGSQVGPTQDKPSVTVSAGQFTIPDLDFGSGAFTGEARWLEVAVRCPAGSGSYSTLGARQAVRPAPNALNADLLDGQHASAFASGSHNHLGQSWVGADQYLRINAVDLGDTANGDGVLVRSAGRRGVYVYSAAEDGFVVESAAGGVTVNNVTWDGVLVRSAGRRGVYVYSAAEDGFVVESAAGYGVRVVSAGNVGVYVGTSNNVGMWVNSSANTGVYANTANADGVWGFDTPDRIRGSNVTLNTLTLLAQVTGSGALTAGDLVTAAGVGQPLAGSAIPVAQVRLAGNAGLEDVIGVVEGRMALTSSLGSEQLAAEKESMPAMELRSAEGQATEGDYVAITVLGVARVKADASMGAIVPGQRLTPAEAAGRARILRTVEVQGVKLAESAAVVGTALEGLASGQGEIWVFVQPR